MPGMLRKSATFAPRYRKFESISLQRRVRTNSAQHRRLEPGRGQHPAYLQAAQGIKWHDGKPFTAADVRCTWDLLIGKSQEKLRLNPRKAWYRNLEEIVTNGDYSVAFVLKRSQPAFLALLASGNLPVYPCHVNPRDMRTHPIGTGPFNLPNSSRTNSFGLSKTRITGNRDVHTSTASNGRSFRTGRPRRSPLSPASST